MLIDVRVDIYVMMSSDLYGTLSRMRGRKCNPFGNVATVSVVQDVADIVYSSVISFIMKVFPS